MVRAWARSSSCRIESYRILLPRSPLGIEKIVSGHTTQMPWLPTCLQSRGLPTPKVAGRPLAVKWCRRKVEPHWVPPSALEAVSGLISTGPRASVPVSRHLPKGSGGFPRGSTCKLQVLTFSNSASLPCARAQSDVEECMRVGEFCLLAASVCALCSPTHGREEKRTFRRRLREARLRMENEGCSEERVCGDGSPILCGDGPHPSSERKQVSIMSLAAAVDLVSTCLDRGSDVASDVLTKLESNIYDTAKNMLLRQLSLR